jgi:hypothetical protein
MNEKFSQLNCWFIINNSILRSSWSQEIFMKNGISHVIAHLCSSDHVGLLSFGSRIRTLAKGSVSDIDVENSLSERKQNMNLNGVSLYDAFLDGASQASLQHIQLERNEESISKTRSSRSASSSVNKVLTYLIIFTDSNDTSSDRKFADVRRSFISLLKLKKESEAGSAGMKGGDVKILFVNFYHPSKLMNKLSKSFYKSKNPKLEGKLNEILRFYEIHKMEEIPSFFDFLTMDLLSFSNRFHFPILSPLGSPIAMSDRERANSFSTSATTDRDVEDDLFADEEFSRTTFSLSFSSSSSSSQKKRTIRSSVAGGTGAAGSPSSSGCLLC